MGLSNEKPLTSVNSFVDDWLLGTLIHFGHGLFGTRAVDIAGSVYNFLKGVVFPTKDVVSMVAITEPNYST